MAYLPVPLADMLAGVGGSDRRTRDARGLTD